MAALLRKFHLHPELSPSEAGGMKWELPKMRGPNIDPRKQGSHHDQDDHKQDPQCIETAKC